MGNVGQMVAANALREGVSMRNGRLLLLGCCLILLSPYARAWEKSKNKTFAEPKPDKALVYFIVHKGPRGFWIYSDTNLIGLGVPLGYTFAYLDPGPHVIWSNRSRFTESHGVPVVEGDFQAGQVYFYSVVSLNTNTLGSWKSEGFVSFNLIEDAQAQPLLEEMKFYTTLTEKDHGKMDKHLGKNQIGDANNVLIASNRHQDGVKMARSADQATEHEQAGSAYSTAADSFEKASTLFSELAAMQKKRAKNLMDAPDLHRELAWVAAPLTGLRIPINVPDYTVTVEKWKDLVLAYEGSATNAAFLGRECRRRSACYGAPDDETAVKCVSQQDGDLESR